MPVPLARGETLSGGVPVSTDRYMPCMELTEGVHGSVCVGEVSCRIRVWDVFGESCVELGLWVVRVRADDA